MQDCFGCYLMAAENQIRDLIRLVYECSVDSRQWRHFLEALTKTLNAPAAVLIAQDDGNRHASVASSHGIDPFWEKRYAEYYVGLNAWMLCASPIGRPGRIFAGEEVVSDAVLEKTEFYNDFLRPQNQFYTVTGFLTQEHSVTSFVSLIRSKAGGPMREDELGPMRDLMPHLQTALGLHRRIAGLETRLEHASDALDQLSGSLIVTDSRGLILHMNRRAEALLSSNIGVWAAPDGLRAGSSHQTARLRELIARAAGTVTGNKLHPGGVIQVQRADLTQLKLHSFPLAASSGHANRRPAVAVFITEPGRVPRPDPDLLALLLDLSPTESRLTAAIVGGKTLQQFAQEAGVSLNTARTLLKRVFAKTGVSRQAELVSLALTCAGGFGPE